VTNFRCTVYSVFQLQLLEYYVTHVKETVMRTDLLRMRNDASECHANVAYF
jgi:hypothetical protein